MKTRFQIRELKAIIIGILLLFSISCTKEDDSNTTYSTSDIEGIWSGDLRILFHGGDLDGEDVIFATSFTFNANGTLDSIEGHPFFLSNTGNLSVNSKGTIEGVITTTHETNPGIETTYENWAGCLFETKTKINISMRWDWTNTRPGNGYSIMTGEFSKQ